MRHMMKKFAWGISIATVAVLAAGCGSGSNTADPGDTSNPAEATTTSTSGPTANELLQKEVGQRAGWACQEGGACALTFTVTDIAAITHDECNSYTAPDEDKRLIKVSIDAFGSGETPAPNSGNPPGLVLLASGWNTVGSDGYSTDAEHAFCLDIEGGPFDTPVDVGQKSRGEAVFAVPLNSTALELRDRVYGGGWTWEIPDA